MSAGHPLARKRRLEFDECRRFPALVQEGPLPRAADIDADFNAFRETLSPKLVSNSISLLKHAIHHNMGLSYFTKLGFLREIADGELVWRPLASRAINTLRLGLMIPTERHLSIVATHLVDLLTRRLRDVERAA